MLKFIETCPVTYVQHDSVDIEASIFSMNGVTPHSLTTSHSEAFLPDFSSNFTSASFIVVALAILVKTGVYPED